MRQVNRKLLTALLALPLLALLAAGISLSWGRDLQEWHRPYQHEAAFDFGQGSFEDYVSYAETLIRAARVDAPGPEQVANLLPFILEPDADCPQGADGKYQNGAVLTHGWTNTPYSLREIGEFFHSRCFYVLGLLLPGHATRPGDFLNIRWEQWAQAQSFAARAASAKVENLFLVGHSAGGTLALLEATQNPDIDALMLFAPALAIPAAARYVKYMLFLGRLFPRAAWLELGPDEDYYRYESFTFRGVAEIDALIRATHKALADQPLDLPILTIASAEDTTVKTEAILTFMAEQENPASFTVLYSQHPLPDGDKRRVYEGQALEQGVLSLSHLALMNSPAHPHYGRDGAYHGCNHYFLEGDNFDRCKAGERDFYGEVTLENLRRGVIERIAFNPFFDEMLTEIELFVEQVSGTRLLANPEK